VQAARLRLVLGDQVLEGLGVGQGAVLRLHRAQQQGLQHALALQGAVDGADEQLGPQGLELPVVGAQAEGSDHRVQITQGGEHDADHAGAALLDAAQQLQPVHVGHGHIQQRDVEAALFQHGG